MSIKKSTQMGGFFNAVLSVFLFSPCLPQAVLELLFDAGVVDQVVA
jgi:hypothetical protein